jgi:hypothetical protein
MSYYCYIPHLIADHCYLWIPLTHRHRVWLLSKYQIPLCYIIATYKICTSQYNILYRHCMTTHSLSLTITHSVSLTVTHSVSLTITHSLSLPHSLSITNSQLITQSQVSLMTIYNRFLKKINRDTYSTHNDTYHIFLVFYLTHLFDRYSHSNAPLWSFLLPPRYQ